MGAIAVTACRNEVKPWLVAHAYLDWLTVVARDEIEALVAARRNVAQALVRERTLTATEIKSLVASQ